MLGFKLFKTAAIIIAWIALQWLSRAPQLQFEDGVTARFVQNCGIMAHSHQAPG
jgi:hypothetical protein